MEMLVYLMQIIISYVSDDLALCSGPLWAQISLTANWMDFSGMMTLDSDMVSVLLLSAEGGLLLP